MHTRIIVLLTLMSCLATAAPALLVPPPLQLNNSTPTLFPHSNTLLNVTDVFPPESQLPANKTFSYHVPSTNIIVIFKQWRPVSRPHYEIPTIFGQATRDTLAFPPDALMIYLKSQISWSSGASFLEVNPLIDRGHWLTWGMWYHILGSIRAWLTAYPGLYPAFEIYETADDGLERWYIGWGNLSTRVSHTDTN